MAMLWSRPLLSLYACLTAQRLDRATVAPLFRGRYCLHLFLMEQYLLCQVQNLALWEALILPPFMFYPPEKWQNQKFQGQNR